MNGYELHDHLRKADPRPFGGDFVNLLSPVISASEEILSHRPFVCPILPFKLTHNRFALGYPLVRLDAFQDTGRSTRYLLEDIKLVAVPKYFHIITRLYTQFLASGKWQCDLPFLAECGKKGVRSTRITTEPSFFHIHRNISPIFLK